MSYFWGAMVSVTLVEQSAGGKKERNGRGGGVGGKEWLGWRRWERLCVLGRGWVKSRSKRDSWHSSMDIVKTSGSNRINGRHKLTIQSVVLLWPIIIFLALEVEILVWMVVWGNSLNFCIMFAYGKLYLWCSTWTGKTV